MQTYAPVCLQELLASMRSAEEVQAALLPLLYALLDVLQQPSLAAKEAIHRCGSVCAG